MRGEKQDRPVRLRPEEYAKSLAERVSAALKPVFKERGVWPDRKEEIERIINGGYGNVLVSLLTVQALEKAGLAKECATVQIIDGINTVTSYRLALPEEEAVTSAFDSLFANAVFLGKKGGYDFNQWRLIRRNVYSTFAQEQKPDYVPPR